MIVKMTKTAPSSDGYYFWRRNKFERVECGIVRSGHFSARTIASPVQNMINNYPDSVWSEKLEFEFENEV